MKTYIVDVCKIPPYSHPIGIDETIRVQSEKDLEDVIQILKENFKKKDPAYDYILYGYTLQDYIERMELIKI